jgi:hypothetical protein
MMLIIGIDELMVDEVAANEEAELEAMLQNLLPEVQQQNSLPFGRKNQHMGTLRGNDIDTPYGSDDDEYDEIFMDVAREETRASSQQIYQPLEYLQSQDSEMMDMS